LTAAIPWDVDELDLSRDGRRIAFTTDEDGVSVLRLRDAASGAELPTPKLAAGTISGVRWRPDGSEIGFALTTAKSPTDAWSWNPDTQSLERWTESESEVPTRNFADAELVR